MVIGRTRSVKKGAVNARNSKMSRDDDQQEKEDGEKEDEDEEEERKGKEEEEDMAEDSKADIDEEIRSMKDKDGHVPPPVRDWLSTIGKKGRATPPKHVT